MIFPLPAGHANEKRREIPGKRREIPFPGRPEKELFGRRDAFFGPQNGSGAPCENQVFGGYY